MGARHILRACLVCIVVSESLLLAADPPPTPTKDLYYFVVDRSLSIDTNRLTKPFRKAVTEYVERLGPDAQVEIVFFNNEASVPMSWYSMDRQAKDEFCQYFDKYFRPRGETRLYATVAEVFLRVWTRESEFRRIRILIISDGEDNWSSPKYRRWEDVEQLLQDDWKVRKGLSAIWAAVEFDPKQKPGPGSVIQLVRNLDREEIQKGLTPPPNAVFSVRSQKVKVNEDVLFSLDEDIDVTAVRWSFGDGSTSDKKTETHRYTAKGLYDVAVDVEGPGGKARQERKQYIQVTEEPLLDARFSWYPLMPRVNQEFRLMDDSLGGPTSWLWECPAMDIRSTDRNPAVTFGKSGKAVVTLTVGMEGKQHSIRHEVEVFDQPPESRFTAEPNVLKIGQVVQLKAARHEKGWTHRWAVGGDVPLVEMGPKAQWKADRTGRVDIMHTAAGPSGGSTKVFTVFIMEESKSPEPEAFFLSSPAKVYVGDPVQFVEGSRGEPNEWTWEIPGVGTRKGRELGPVTFSQPGKVVVGLTVARGDKQNSLQREVEVLPVVVAEFTAEPGAVEIGDGVLLKAARHEAGWTHTWTVDDKDLGTKGPEAQWRTDKTGPAVIVHSVLDGAGPAKERTKVVVVRDRLLAKFHGSPSRVRVGEQVVFMDESGGQPSEWTWEIPGIGTRKGRDPGPVAFSKPGKVVVKLTVVREGRRHTAQQEVTVESVNLAAFDAGPREGLSPLAVQFTDRSQGDSIVSWHWDFGDGQTSDEKDPNHTYQVQGQGQSFHPRLTIRDSAGQEARCLGNIEIRLTLPISFWSQIPLWLMLLALAGVLFLLTLVVIGVKRLFRPHRKAAP